MMFELFLESKLEALEEATSSVSTAATELAGNAPFCPVQLGDGLRSLPQSFLDTSHEFVENIYFKLPTGFGAADNQVMIPHIALAAREEDLNGNHNPFLYGEVSASGTRTLLTDVILPMLKSAKLEERRSFTFVDLGSGTGKLVTELAHLVMNATRTAVSYPLLSAPSSFIGIELDSYRAGIAQQAFSDAAFQAAFFGTQKEVDVRFYSGDMFELLPTIVSGEQGQQQHLLFCCGVGFSDEFVVKLCDLIYDSYHVHQSADGSINASLLRGCLFLFKAHPMGHPLYAAATSCEPVTIGTNWMDEAPALVLKF